MFEKFEEEPMTPRTSQAKTARNIFPMQAWEPTLDEMLAEPVVQLMMTVDGVRPDDVVALLREARERLD
jgi:hypothetical protein